MKIVPPQVSVLPCSAVKSNKILCCNETNVFNANAAGKSVVLVGKTAK